MNLQFKCLGKELRSLSFWNRSFEYSLIVLMTACGTPRSKTVEITAQPTIVTDVSTSTLPPLNESDSSGTNANVNVATSLREADSKIVNAAPASDRISAHVTLKKSEIFGKTFLYGFDLQYSSVGNAEYSLLDQTLALGHIPAVFRQVDQKLQLLADNQRLFESVVNRPETLINEYAITSESSEELTITIDRPGMLLNKTVNGKDAPAPQSHWLRSLSYVAEGNYLLQETAIMNEKGEVQTFMESLFPRATLVPDGYVGIEDNRDENPDAERFMFLGAEKVFVERKQTNGVPVREQTTFASRFHLKDKDATIDWYVTANAPDELMKELKSGVLAWNRYYVDQLGREVVRFMGRLPESVKIGDPRYNVINFDTVAEAGAAYESQAVDPMTGIQSHSLIYMPYAWYNIAAGLIKTREIPDSKSKIVFGPKSPEVMFGQSKPVVQCLRFAEEALASRTPEETVDDFGRRVFISTLFHEMGHALGLGHNFKGSMSFDGAQPWDAHKNPTTHSVMDYNYYQHELDLVGELGTSEGRRLEYDRQIISHLYNGGKDIVKDKDPILPSCNDDDADEKGGGIDQNCLRYDAESNPILGLEHALVRFKEASGSKGLEKKTLSEAIQFHRDQLIAKLSDARLSPDAKGAETIVKSKASGLNQLITYYLAGGAQSLRVNLTNNAGSIRKWRHVDKDDGISMTEADRRTKYVSLVKSVLSMKGLPEAPLAAVQGLTDLIVAVIQQNERYGTVEERQLLSTKLKGIVDLEVSKAFAAGLGRTRAGLAEKLGFDKELSFASGLIDGMPFEQFAVNTLVEMVDVDLTKDSLGDSNAVKARMNAANALATFGASSDDYKSEIEAARSKLTKISKEALVIGNQDVRDHIRTLLKTL
ncbi:MAG: zinc-dependent metalloprotease [Proteobacteria bacterium]|nr:zinc-dependent metalloprotease [Pseudomonadota bacterium]